VIARLACALDHAIYISLAEAAERQRKRRIEISRSFEVLDRLVNVLARNRVIDETSQTVAAAQIFFVCFGVSRATLLELILFIRRQFEPQPIANLLRDRVLNVDDVGRVSVDATAPQQIA